MHLSLKHCQQSEVTMETITAESSASESNFQEAEKGNLNGRDVEIQNHMDNSKEHIKDFFLGAIEASAHVLMNRSYIGVTEAGKMIRDNPNHLIEGCKEYNKAIELKNREKGLDKFYNPIKIERDYGNDIDDSCYERGNDYDSWDKEY